MSTKWIASLEFDPDKDAIVARVHNVPTSQCRLESFETYGAAIAWMGRELRTLGLIDRPAPVREPHTASMMYPEPGALAEPEPDEEFAHEKHEADSFTGFIEQHWSDPRFHQGRTF